MSGRARIDPNVRVRGNQTFVGYEDLEGVVTLGAPIEVYEQETDAVGRGVVTEIDAERCLVFIAVEWRSLCVRARSYFVGSQYA